MEKPLQTLHKSLLANNFDVPENYSSFEETLSLPGNEGYQNRLTLWKALKDNDFDVPDNYDDFRSTLFDTKPKKGGMIANTVKAENGMTFTEAGLDSLEKGATPVYVVAETEPQPTEPIDLSRPEEYQIPKPFVQGAEEARRMADSPELNKQWAQRQADAGNSFMHPEIFDFSERMGAIEQAQQAEAARQMKRSEFDKQNTEKFYQEHVAPVFAEERAAGEERAKKAVQDAEAQLAERALSAPQTVAGATSNFASAFQTAVNVERETDPAKIAAATIKRVQNDDAFGDYVLSRMGISGKTTDNTGAGESEPLSEREKKYMQLLFATETNEVADQMIQRIYDQYKAEGAPKSALDYIAGKAFHENFVASLFDAMVRRVANSSGMREQLRAMASEEYVQDASWLTRAAGGAAPFAVDMLTGGFAAPTAVGNALVKGGMRMAAKEVTREMGKRAAARGLKDAALEEAVAGGAGVAERYLATQAPILNFALRSAGSAANFATYDVQSEAVRQLAEGEFNAGNLIKQAVHGATLGGILGATGGVIANATRNSGLTKKVLADIAGVGAETGIFAAANGIEKAHQLGIDIADVDWADTTGEALGMVLGMKTVGAVTHPKEFLKRYQQSKDLGMQLNQRDIEELKQAGYNFDSIFKGLGEFGKIAPESATVRRAAAEYTEDATGKRGQRNTETTEAYVDADAFDAVMRNPEISSSLKRKVAFIATGKVLSLEPVFGASMDIDENGNVTITTKNVYGNPIETKEYQSIEQAQQDYQLMQEMARANTIGGLERIADKTGYQDVVDTAKGRTEAETGVDVDNLDKLSELTTEEANGVLDAYIKNLQDAYMERFNENLERIGTPAADATGTVADDGSGLPTDGSGTTKTERRQAAYERGASVAEDESQLPAMNYDGKLAEARMLALMPDGEQAGYARQQVMQAIEQGDVEAAERILQQQSPYLSAEQRKAVEAYIDAYETRLGIDDAIERKIADYEYLRREQIMPFADPQGDVTALRLRDDSIVYYQSGDMNGYHSTVFVTTEDGRTDQVDSNEIVQVEYTRPAEDIIAEEVADYGNKLAQRYNMLAEGSMLMDGQEADMVMGNQLFHVTALGLDEQGNTVVQMEDGSRMAMTPEQMAEAIDAADMVKIQELLAQEKNAAAEQQRTLRFDKGIVGYAEGTPDLTNKDTKPEVAAEYLLSQVGPDGQPVDRKVVLSDVDGQIAKLSVDKDSALQALQQTSNDMAMADDAEADALRQRTEQLEAQIATIDAQRRKWGEIRQAMMTDEERLAFEKDRIKEIGKAKSQSKIVAPEGEPAWKVNMPTKEQVVEKYPERSDGEAFVEEQRKQLSKMYRQDVYPTYDNIQKQLDDYQHGLTDLTPNEVKSLTDEQARLGLRMTQMVEEMNAWKKLGTDLARAYTINERQNMTPHEQAMAKLAGETDKTKKLKLAQEAFKDDPDAAAILDNVEPQDVYEYIAENLGKGSINWEGLKRGEHEVRGLIAEMGKDKKRGVGAGYDTNGYNYFLAPTGQGKGIDEIIHDLYEGSPYRDDEVRNALLTMLKEAEKPTDISHRVIDDRIAQAELIYEQNRERERELEEEAQRQAEDEAIMQMTGMTPEEYDAFTADLEQRLAEQEGYQNSEEYFNQLANEYDRTNERRAGGSQEESTLVMQGQEGKQAAAEAEGQGGAGENDAELAAKHLQTIKDGVDLYLKKYRTLAPLEMVDINSDEQLAKIVGDVFVEDLRKYLKKYKVPALYDTENKKIYIFAEYLSPENVEEAIFHENIHRGLEQYYGNGLREVSEAFWNTASPTNPEATAKHKAAIQERYQDEPEESQHEEYLVHVFAHQMATGKVDNLFPRLSPEHQEIIDNILHNIGYDRAKEATQRRGQQGSDGADKEEVPAAVQESGPGGRVDYGRKQRTTPEVQDSGAGKPAEAEENGEVGPLKDVIKIDDDNYSKEEQKSLKYIDGESFEEYSKRNNSNVYDAEMARLYLQQKYADRLDEIAGIIGNLTPDNVAEAGKKIGEMVDSRDEGYAMQFLLRNIHPETILPFNGAVSAVFDKKIFDSQEDVSFPARLAKAKEEVNTQPTEEQKKAGNYKMGHISFGGYQMSIENPKGSVRSGKDANDKPWSIEMQDTYGYIGKKYGTDGDHLDFFINDDADLDSWNGRVYVVDQKNEDGTFDEHKVMYGYPSYAAAKRAYMRNYEPGWWDKHVMQMTGVRKSVFDKWLEDSDHKTKPFAEYSRTRQTETVSNNMEQLMADVEERKNAKPAEPSGETVGVVEAGYKVGELEAMSIDELKQARKKRKADLSTARLMLGTIDKLKNTEKGVRLQNTVAQATADIAAIDKEIEKKSDLFRQAVEQQEIGGAMVDQLEGMGFDVSTDPAEMRKVRKQAEKDNSEEGKLRHFETPDGKIYGFVYRGKMYLDPRKIDAELPIHEYAHPWCEAFRRLNPEGWQNIVGLMKADKDTWEFIKALNPDLKSEDDIAEEMITKCSGQRGAEWAEQEYARMNQRDPNYKSKWGNIWKNISKAIQDFWKAIGDFLHIKYESAEQVYDQVVRDFANKMNPRKRVEQWLKERDNDYVKAVEAGDNAKAKELFDAALRENIGNGITPYIAVEGYRKMRPLAHAVKERDPQVIAKVADMMAPLIPKDAVLVPAPSHSGKATDMLDLAKAISERTGAPVADVLTSGERPSQYKAKYAGKPIASSEMGIVAATDQLPADKLPVVIDNVVDTGNTAEACIQALGKGIVASLADSVEKRKHVASLKSAEPVVTDKNGNVIPLSDRFQFMIEEGNLFSDEDFEEPAREAAGTVVMDMHGFNLNSPLGKRLAELKKQAGENGLVGYTTDDGYVFVGDSTKAVGNTYTSEGERDGMQTVTVSQKQFDTLSPKLVKAGYKMAFLESADVESEKPEADATGTVAVAKSQDAVEKVLKEVERRKEVSKDKKEADDIIKQYLGRKPKTEDERVKQLATKAVLKAMDNAGVPYKAVSKEEEKQMLKIFSMMNQEPIKEFARSAYMRANSPHGSRGRYIIYDMSNPYGVPMYFEKLSTAKFGLESMQRLVPDGSWEIMDIGYPEDVAAQSQIQRKAAEYYELMQMMGGDKKTSASATALGEKSPLKDAVVTDSDFAKVQNNLETLAKNTEKISNEEKNRFISLLAKAVGAKKRGSNSQYVTIEAKNGTVVTLRLADHNVTVSNFDYSEEPNGVSIVISRKPNAGVTNDGNAHIVEYFYPDKELRKADGSPYSEIVKSVEQMLYSGEYKDTTGIAQPEEVNNPMDLQADIETWHGSGYTFTKFDHSNMGKGAGSQVFGWGTYLTDGEKIAEDYANSVAKRKYNDETPGYNGKEVLYKGEKIDLDQSKLDPLRLAYDTLNSEGTIRKAVTFVERLMDYAEEQDMKDTWQEVLNILKNSKKSDFKVRDADLTDKRLLYKVEIPEDTGDNYLDWMVTIKKPLRKKIADAVRQLDGEPKQSFIYTNYKNGWESLADMIEREQFAYKEIHDRLLMAFGGRVKDAERVSKLMNSLGFVGVKYPAGTIWGGGNGATNYVIFNEDDAKIVQTISFMWGDEPADNATSTAAPIFISNALSAVEAIKQEKATPEQWLAMLQKNGGLKAGEDKWLGLSDWLKDQKGSVTKQDLLDYIRKNQIQVEDVNYSNIKRDRKDEDYDSLSVSSLPKAMREPMEALNKRWSELYHEARKEADSPSQAKNAAFEKLREEYGSDFITYFATRDTENLVVRNPRYLQDAAKMLGVEVDIDNPINGTRMAYTTNGLDNKREIALTVPTIEPWNESDEIHFGDAGGGRAVAWVRFGDTEIEHGMSANHQAAKKALDTYYDSLVEKYATGDDPLELSTKMTDEEHAEMQRLEDEYSKTFDEGKKKVLVIDEIQSKRHQEGRDKGYRVDPPADAPEKMAYDKANEEYHNYSSELRKKYGRDDISYGLTEEERSKMGDLFNKTMQVRVDYNKYLQENGYGPFSGSDIPDAPFDKNWHELAMKRMLRYAAENGYDKVAWTTGDQQADRYDLGGVIDSINAYPHSDPMTGEVIPEQYDVFVKDKRGGYIHEQGMEGLLTKEQILQNFGKDLGARIIKEADEHPDGTAEISGDGLRIGGEGMKGFYDEMLPRFMNKYGKKWGVKVEKIDLPALENDGVTMWSIDVTPEMRESVMQGQPMFQKEGKKLLGWSDGKQVYLTKDGLNPNTPLHETTHLWDNWCMKEHPDLWQKLVAAMKKTAMWEEVASNPNYRNIWNDENRMASEVHARLSGAAGEDEFMKAAFKKNTPKSIINEVKNALRKFWEAVLRLFGKHTKTIGDDWTSLDAIIRMPIRDLVNQDFEKVMKVADPYDDANAMLGYHGSSAIFDKFDLSKVGSGEGQAVSGHGIYVTSSEGTARYYAKVSSDRRRNVIQKMGYTVNGEIVHDPALVRANEYLKKADNNVDEAIKACEHTIEILNRHRDKNPFGSLPDAGKSNAEQAMDYLLQEKEHPGTLGFQEEIVEQPAKQVYEVEIPDDTGKNYFDLDKKLTKKQKEDIKKAFFERINSGDEAEYWKKNRDIIDYEWKIVDSNEGTGDAARGVMEQFLPSEDVSKIFSELGYVGSKVKGSDGTTYIIYNVDDLKIKKRAELMFHIEDDPETVKRLDKEPKEVGYRNVVANEDGTLGSPMANRLGKKGEGKKATTPFEYGKWERSDEHPELANEQGKIDLIKPDGKPVGGVDYNPYIHIRPNKVNKQFKQAWERPNLIYVETEYPKSELNGEYHADKAAKPVGKHKWGTQGEYLILSRWDKPVRMVPWEEVADDWVKEFEGTDGIHFDIIPPKLLPILAERGMKILPPHKGMGKDCQEAYKEWKDEHDIMRSKGKKLAAHDTTGFADVAEAAGEALGGVKVNAVTSADADAKLKAEIEAGTKGIYDPNTHTVTLLLDNIEDANDAVRTVFHEKLGHEGLVDLLGGQDEVNKFGTFVYRSAKNNVRKRILDKADEIDSEWMDGARYSKAAQEILADIAEEGPKTADEFDLWTKVKHYLIALLNKLGAKVRGLLNDKDLAYYIVKTGAALKKWDKMSETERANLSAQASNHDIMRSVNGKPRQKKGESMAQYFQRLKEWEKWREARRMAKENGDPEPKEEDFHERAEADYKQALQEWMDDNGVSGTDGLGAFPKRQDGETPQEYAVRVAQYESDKDMWSTAPKLMDYLRRANEDYRAAYTAWRERYDLQEEMSVDQRIYEGTVEPQPTFTDAEQEAQYLAEKDLADAEGFEIDEEGAKRMAKLAVIERRKDFESANAEDAIWVYDFVKKSDAVAKELAARIPDATGKELRAALPFLIEADRRRENLEAERENAVMEVNKSEAVQKAHTFIDYYNMDAIEDELKALNDAWDYKEKHPTGDAQQAYREAAARLAEKLNQLNQNKGGYNKLFADDIMQIRSLLNTASVTGRGDVMPEWAEKYQGQPEVQQLMEHIKAWYDEFYQVLEDAGLRGDAGFIDDGYVNHVWDKEKSDPKAWEQYIENRQRTKSPNMRHREIDTYMDGISIGLVPKYTDISDMIAHYSRQNNEAVANSHFLDDLKFVVVQEMNDEGEVKAILPLLMTDKPDGLLRDKYAQYYVPGVGDVYVLKHIQKRFANIFGTMRTPDAAQWLSNIGKGYDIVSSTAKKIQLALSGFHALALWEVDIAQNGPVDALKHLAKYIIVDSIKGNALPAYTHPEDFQLAAKHLVQLGATEDYAAADVNAITKKMREFFKGLQMDDAAWKKAAGTVGSPAAIFMDWINQGFDTVLWNYLHDGLKLCAFKELAKQVDRRVADKGLDEDTRERMLDEAGQYVNDMFGGQYWELINISPATLKWMRRFFLSPDWLISTNRHFFANFGFGSIYSDGGFRKYIKYNWDNIQRMFGKDVASNELRRLRSRNAKICYLIGAVIWFGMFYNAINALMRWMDEKDEKAKADEQRKTNPNYKSPYELAYPDGMKWYDYTMYGNAVGQQTHLFTGRYSDGTETYVRWGKQFREFPELFIGRHGVEFPSPLIQRMMSKANPNIGTVIDFLGAQNIGGFNGSYENKELREKYGKTVATLSAMARHFIPFGMPTQTDKEYKWLDFFMPSSKGFSRYKAKDYFETFIMDGDWNGIEATYNACVMNGIDAEKALNAAISSIKATQRREMTDDVTDLSSAALKFDAATNPDERKVLLNKLKKHLKDSEYKAMTREEAIEKVHNFIDGDGVDEKENARYVMLATSKDIIAEEKLKDLGRTAKKFKQEVDAAKGTDKYADMKERYGSWLLINKKINKATRDINKEKKRLGSGMNEDEVMKKIRETIRKAQADVDEIQAPQ